MKSIYKNNKITLNQINKNRYNLVFDNEFNMFNNFYKKNLDLYKKANIEFKSDKLISLPNLLKENNNELDYELSKILFFSLSQQIEIILNKEISPLSLKPEDIYFIESGEKKVFLFLNLDNVFEINEGKIEIRTPFRQHKFFSPELRIVKSFPVTITKKSIYFSLGLCVANCLNKFSERITIDFDFKNHIEMIKETKLYWALLRCLEKDPQNRFCLFI